MENRRPIVKRVSFRLVELPILLNSAAIHYTSNAERAEAASLDLHLAEHESVVIPLPVERVAQGNAERFLDRYPKLRGYRIILILSRIHPMKGIELLLDAFAIVRNQRNEVALVIAGEGEEAYRRELQERARRRELRTGTASGSACPTIPQQEDTKGDWTAHST